MKRILVILSILIGLSLSSFSQTSRGSGTGGETSRSMTATERLQTDGIFVYDGDTIPVADLTYHEFSADSITWRKNYVAGDPHMRFSNDIKGTWFTLDLSNIVPEEYVDSISYEPSTWLFKAFMEQGDTLTTPLLSIRDSIKAVQNELDTTQVYAGLSELGKYLPIVTANYISGAITLADADSLLDVQIKVNEDSITNNRNALIDSSRFNSTDGYLRNTRRDLSIDSTSFDGRYVELSDSITQWVTITQLEDSIANRLKNPVEILEYDTTYVSTGVEPKGASFWDETNRTVSISLGNGVVLQVGKESLIDVYNDSGVDIEDGRICYGSGVNTVAITVAKASNNERYSALLAATEYISNNSYGICIELAGRLNGVNTGSLIKGLIYLGLDGLPTNTNPEFPLYSYPIGAVIKTGVTDGVIQFRASDISFTNSTSNTSNGTIREQFNLLVTSNGTTITGTLEQAGGGDLTMVFSDGWFDLDCTPAQTITLTGGADAIPQGQYLYIPKSTKILTLSTAGWPSEEHIRISDIGLWTALKTQTYGAVWNRNWNDRIQGTDGRGDRAKMGERIRQSHAEYTDMSGGALTVDIQAGATPDDAYLSTTSFMGYQKNSHIVPLWDMELGDILWAVNDPDVAWTPVTNLNEVLEDSEGVSLTGNGFSLVLGCIMNKTGEPDQFCIFLPNDSYANPSQSSADGDPLGYANYTYPDGTKGKYVMLYRINLQWNNGGTELTLLSATDLRGSYPTATGKSSGSGGGGVTSFDQLDDTPVTKIGQATKLIAVGQTETALEYIDYTTADLDTIGINRDSIIVISARSLLNEADRHVAVTVTDSPTIDLSLVGQDIAAFVIPAGISHTAITDIGINTHPQIDDYIAVGHIPLAQKAAANGVATLDASSKIPISQIPDALIGAVVYQGTWDADTNNPTLVSSTGTKGHYYTVTVAGNTTLDGTSGWRLGDMVIFNGTIWEKIDNNHDVLSVNGATGTVVLTTSEITEGSNLYYTEGRVSANTDVSANTTARHDAVTLAGTLDYLTLSNQEITLNDIDLTTDVTGILPITNGGTGSATKNFVDLTTSQNNILGNKTFVDNPFIGDGTAASALTINSGGVGTSFASVIFQDEGVSKWQLRKDDNNNLSIFETGVAEQMNMAPGGGTTFTSTLAASNLSGTNTGDEDLSTYISNAGISTDRAISIFDGITGKIIQNSLATIAIDGTIIAPKLALGGVSSSIDELDMDGTFRIQRTGASGETASLTLDDGTTAFDVSGQTLMSWGYEGTPKMTLSSTGVLTHASAAGVPTNSALLSDVTSAIGASTYWTASGNDIYNSNSGNVGIGTTSPNVKTDILSGNANTVADILTAQTLSVTGANIAMGGTGINTGILSVASNDAQGTGIGGSIAFSGRFSGTSGQAGFASIIGAKENSVSGEFGSYLAFGTRSNGADIIEALRLNSDQSALFASDLSVTGALTAAGVNSSSLINYTGGNAYGIKWTAGSSGYTYADGGGVGITNVNPFGTGALLYLNGTNFDVFLGGASKYQLDATGNSTQSGALTVAGGKSILGTDGSLLWGSAAANGKLTYTGTSAIIRGQSGMSLSLGANGNQGYLVINTDGNIGIGTGTPSRLIEASSPTQATGSIMRLTNAVDASTWSLTDEVGSIEFYASDPSGVGVKSKISSRNFVNGATAPLGGLVFETQGSDRMVIDNNGNVGIMVTDPDSELEVAGQIKIVDGSQGVGKVLTSDADGLASWETPATGGDVTGAASSTDNAIARFDLTTGKIIQNSGVIIDDSNNITGINSGTFGALASVVIDDEIFWRDGITTVTSGSPDNGIGISSVNLGGGAKTAARISDDYGIILRAGGVDRIFLNTDGNALFTHATASPRHNFGEFGTPEANDAYITKDGSENMTFTDAVTGTKTLAELVGSGASTITLSGDVTGSGTTAITTTIAAGSVDPSMLSATGTPTTFLYLRGDNTWASFSTDVSSVAAVFANTQKVTNATHTGDVTGSTVLTIATDAVDIAMLSATGTPSSSTYLRGDNTWGTPISSSLWTDNGTSLSPTNDEDILLTAATAPRIIMNDTSFGTSWFSLNANTGGTFSINTGTSSTTTTEAIEVLVSGEVNMATNLNVPQEVRIGSASDLGAYDLQVNGDVAIGDGSSLTVLSDNNNGTFSLKSDYDGSGEEIFYSRNATTDLTTLSSIFKTIPRASAPSSPALGWIYVNSTDNHIYFYNGSTWVQMDN